MEWFRRWFGEDYLLVYGHRDEAEAERDILFAARVLGLDRGMRALDLCCGSGRHARALARLGLCVTGVDYSAPLLAAAGDTETDGSDQPRYVRADARSLPFRDGAFDAVLNLFTSFGYFEHRENCGMLAETARVLRSGGAFLIDYLNPPRVLAELVPETERELNGMVVTECRRHDPDTCRVEKTIRIRSCGCEREFSESVRLYTLAEMTAMLDGAGLALEGADGSNEGEPYSESSARMILRGRKR